MKVDVAVTEGISCVLALDLFMFACGVAREKHVMVNNRRVDDIGNISSSCFAFPVLIYC